MPTSFFGCLPTVFRPRGAVFTCGAFDVYLRWFRLHSAGVSLSIPPVAPADVPALFHPRIRTFTCGATDIYLRCYRLHGGCGFEFTSGGSCGRACNVPPIDWDIYLRCKNISYRARYRPLAKSERKAQGRKGHTKTAEVHGANGD